jgi:AcrR family transcriptional regulator
MGRPREFDIEQAIAIATNLFWEKGYEGTSLSDLTKAIGITPPSFYFAFGSKEGLFRKVIERYYMRDLVHSEEAFREPTARAVAERLLYGYADLQTSPAHAPGCLAMNSALPCAEGDPIRNWMAGLREKMRVRLRDRFAVARDNGDLPANADLDALARLVLAIGWGMAVEAQSGASREDLHRTISVALAGWPTNQRRRGPTTKKKDLTESR